MGGCCGVSRSRRAALDRVAAAKWRSASRPETPEEDVHLELLPSHDAEAPAVPAKQESAEEEAVFGEILHAGKSAFAQFKESPFGIFLLERWLPLQDTGLDLLVIFGRKGWPLCSDDGLLWSTDFWWSCIAVGIVCATYVVWFALSFPIISKQLEKLHPRAVLPWLVLGVPLLLLGDLAFLALWPTARPTQGWLLNMMRLRLVTETLLESPGQALLQSRMLYVKVVSHRTALTWRNLLTLICSIATSMVSLALTLKDIYDMAQAQGIHPCTCLWDTLLVGLELQAPLLHHLKKAHRLDYAAEGALTDEHVRQISLVFPTCGNLKRLDFSSDNEISEVGWTELGKAIAKRRPAHSDFILTFSDISTTGAACTFALAFGQEGRETSQQAADEGPLCRASGTDLQHAHLRLLFCALKGLAQSGSGGGAPRLHLRGCDLSASALIHAAALCGHLQVAGPAEVSLQASDVADLPAPASKTLRGMEALEDFVLCYETTKGERLQISPPPGSPASMVIADAAASSDVDPVLALGAVSHLRREASRLEPYARLAAFLRQAECLRAERPFQLEVCLGEELEETKTTRVLQEPAGHALVLRGSSAESFLQDAPRALRASRTSTDLNRFVDLRHVRGSLGPQARGALTDRLAEMVVDLEVNGLVLDLSRNDLGPEGAEGLAEGLARCSGLQRLGLGLARTRLNSSGFLLADGSRAGVSLGACLGKLRRLERLALDVRDNSLGGDFLEGLVSDWSALSQLSHLTLVLGSFDGTNNAALEILASGLRHLPQLRELRLDFAEQTQTGPAGCRSLADGLAALTNLTTVELLLNWTAAGVAGGRHLAESLARLPGLQILTLDLTDPGLLLLTSPKNRFTPESRAELRQLLAHVPDLDLRC